MWNPTFSRVALLVAAISIPAASTVASVAAAPVERRAVREVTLPAGTLLPLTLDTYVASDTSRIESPVRAHLRAPVRIDGVTVLPAGTPLRGYVTSARRSARVKGRAHVAFRFTSLAVDGERYELQTSRVVRQAPGTKKRDAATIAIPAGAGAVIGAIADGKKGAAIGSAIGGAGGTGVVLSTRGKEVRLGRGAPVAVRLLRPLRVTL
jgi:hypothetical protein